MTTLAPPILMKMTTTSVSSAQNWPIDGSAYAGYPYRWTVTMTITPQSTSYPTSSTPYFYNGTNVAVGMWISNEVGGFACKIISISSANATAVTCIVEDVNQYNTYGDPSGNGDGSPANHVSGFIFSLNAVSNPILTPVAANVITSQWQTDLMSRFNYSVDQSANSIINAIIFG